MALILALFLIASAHAARPGRAADSETFDVPSAGAESANLTAMQSGALQLDACNSLRSKTPSMVLDVSTEVRMQSQARWTDRSIALLSHRHNASCHACVASHQAHPASPFTTMPC